MTPDRFLYLVEGLGDRLPYLRQEFPDMSEEDIVRIANSDPTEGKYIRWILYQVDQGNLRFPEDHEKVHTRLTQFDALKKKRNFSGERDINKYAFYGDLAQTIDQNSGVKTKGEITREKEIEGARLLAQQGNLAVYEITTLEAGLKLGWRDTEWCVKDPKFFDQYGPPYYMLTKNGRPEKLLHTDSRQLMNMYDKRTSFKGFDILGMQFISNDPNFANYYAREIIKGRFPEGEPAMAKDAPIAFNYALFTLTGRFPEGEPTIAKDPRWAYYYARDIIKGRWPEAEPVIAKDPDWAYDYATDIIKGRWPEAEPAIATDPVWSYQYAINIIKGKFPEGEHIVAKSLPWAYYYARDIIKDRWPEGEDTIRGSDHWDDYKDRFLS